MKPSSPGTTALCVQTIFAAPAESKCNAHLRPFCTSITSKDLQITPFSSGTKKSLHMHDEQNRPCHRANSSHSHGSEESPCSSLPWLKIAAGAVMGAGRKLLHPPAIGMHLILQPKSLPSSVQLARGATGSREPAREHVLFMASARTMRVARVSIKNQTAIVL